MAVENKYVQTDLGTGTLLDTKSNGGGQTKFFRVAEEIAAADDDGSVYRFFRIPSNAGIKSVAIWNDAITGGSDYDIGLYDIDSGAVVDKDLFADGISVATAGDATNVLTAPDIADLGKRVWEFSALSLTKDPQKEYDVAITANTVGTAAGTIVLEMEIIV